MGLTEEIGNVKISGLIILLIGFTSFTSTPLMTLFYILDKL